ncbi:hypothetical protein LTR15_005447 [Elasticomyces elasticus]|nr:hypothetical protein LTR15_005447 [Elasticomyces elasticus]
MAPTRNNEQCQPSTYRDQRPDSVWRIPVRRFEKDILTAGQVDERHDTIVEMRSNEQSPSRADQDVRRDSVMQIPPVRLERRTLDTAHFGKRYDTILDRMLNEHYAVQYPRRCPIVSNWMRLTINDLLLASIATLHEYPTTMDTRAKLLSVNRNDLPRVFESSTLQSLPRLKALPYTYEGSEDYEGDSTKFIMSAKLKAFLDEHLSAPRGAQRYIWVDHICLDMDNPAERKSQIALAHVIYVSAHSYLSDALPTPAYSRLRAFRTYLELVSGRVYPSAPDPASIRFSKSTMDSGDAASKIMASRFPEPTVCEHEHTQEHSRVPGFCNRHLYSNEEVELGLGLGSRDSSILTQRGSSGSCMVQDQSDFNGIAIKGCTITAVALLLLVICDYVSMHRFAGTSARESGWENWMKGRNTKILHTRFLENPSPLVFVGSAVEAALMMRLYAHHNRLDRYQRWFLVFGFLCWPMISTIMGFNLLAGSICVMPWTVFGSLLVSHAVHFVMRRMTRPRLFIMTFHCDLGKDREMEREDGRPENEGEKHKAECRSGTTRAMVG